MSKKISYSQIITAAKKKQIYPIYFLHGEESFFIDKIVDYFEQHLLDDTAKAFNQTILYGKDIDYKTVLDHARRYPVMSDRQLIIVKEAQDLKTLDSLEAYFQQPLSSTVLIFAHKNKKLDSRKKIGKLIKSSSDICLFESTKLYENKVPQWIQSQLSEKGVNIQPAASRLLADYLGTDLSKISNEIEKLLIGLSAGDVIDKHIIQKNIGISKDFNVFELQKSLGAKEKDKCYLIVKYFSANSTAHPLPMITATLYNFFSKVFICQSHRTGNDRELCTAMGINPFFLKDYKIAARNYPRQKLEEVISILTAYDLKSKGVDAGSTTGSELLREMVIKILN